MSLFTFTLSRKHAGNFARSYNKIAKSLQSNEVSVDEVVTMAGVVKVIAINYVQALHKLKSIKASKEDLFLVDIIHSSDVVETAETDKDIQAISQYGYERMY